MYFIFCLAGLFLPTLARVEDVSIVTAHTDLTTHFIGYLSVIVTIAAYIAAMSEEVSPNLKNQNLWC